MAFSVRDSEASYEEYYRDNAERFAAFLGRTLGGAREGAGGRVAVADTLQEAMLVAHRRWPDLEHADASERDRCVYRCLRDAAGEALRREHGRLEKRHGRPRVVAFDFGLLHARDGDALPARDRELTTAVLGSMAADVAAAGVAGERRELLDRAVLLAGLRALNEREVVVLVAVDYLDWEQQELAVHLGFDGVALRTTLFEARRVFYGVVRHAAGIELDEEERARLHAYQAGELAGRERRVARRHVQHCQACQAMLREIGRFGGQAQQVLAPLPFVFGAAALARRVPVKAAPVAGGAAGAGLFGQAGAAKALGVTVGLLSAGVGLSGWLAEQQPPRARGPQPSLGALTPATGLGSIPVNLPAATGPKPAAVKRSTTKGSARKPSGASRRRAGTNRQSARARGSSSGSPPAQGSPPASQQQQQPAAPVAPAASSATNKRAAPSSGGSGGAANSGSGGSEFFAG